MTHKAEHVEPPLSLRSVQVPVAVLLALALLLAACRIPAAPPDTDPEVSAVLAIDLNRASPRELSLLPGVGPILARRIAENRARLGRFTSARDVGRVHGVGDKTIDRIARYVTVDAESLTR